MRLTILFLLIACTGFITDCNGSSDTLAQEWHYGIRAFREKSIRLLMGCGIQQAVTDDKREYSRKYVELGLHHTRRLYDGHHIDATFTQGLSVEVAPERTTIAGFKYSAWANIIFFVFGINGIYYTDFNHGNFKIRPEFGLGFSSFKLVMGYNIPTISNRDFEKLRRADVQITLNVLLKLKRLKKENL